MLAGFDPTLILVLNLIGTFVFAINGGLAAARKGLDAFGVIVIAAAVGLAGGITRDLLLGLPSATFRDWRYLAVVAVGGLFTVLAAPSLARFSRTIEVFDAAGLAVFCVTGAATALAAGVGPVGAVILGAVTGIGGGIVRDILLRQIPVVLHSDLYALPALIGAAVVVVAYQSGHHHPLVPVVGAITCFAIRLLGMHYNLHLPAARGGRAADDDRPEAEDMPPRPPVRARGVAGDDGADEPSVTRAAASPAPHR